VKKGNTILEGTGPLGKHRCYLLGFSSLRGGTPFLWALVETKLPPVPFFSPSHDVRCQRVLTQPGQTLRTLTDLSRPGKSKSSSEVPLIPAEEGNNTHIYPGMEREKDDREIWGGWLRVSQGTLGREDAGPWFLALNAV